MIRGVPGTGQGVAVVVELGRLGRVQGLLDARARESLRVEIQTVHPALVVLISVIFTTTTQAVRELLP